MANYSLNDLVNGQSLMQGRFAQNAIRFRRPATALEFFAPQNRNIMLPDYKALRTSEKRPIDIKYFKRSSRALTHARTHDHTGVLGDSGNLTPSWTIYADKFASSLKQADNHVTNLAEEVANEYQNLLANFYEGWEDEAVSYLSENLSAVNDYARQGSFNENQKVFEIEENNLKRAIQIAKSMMDANKYQGIPLIAFCDSLLFDLVEQMAFQGAGNSENLAFNFTGIRFVKSLGLDTFFTELDGAYDKGAAIIVPEGMIAGLDWIPRQNANGVDVPGIATYGVLPDPLTGMMLGQHVYNARTDNSATGNNRNGHTQDVNTEVEVAHDLAFVSAPGMAATEKPMFAIALVDAIVNAEM